MGGSRTYINVMLLDLQSSAKPLGIHSFFEVKLFKGGLIKSVYELSGVEKRG